ncbi:hypothetical protein GT037_004120 [Alternaria burnsii]|uniref:Uncharacterized protein n=1 Tax=Alternaria burnsii TaxID=1187904 RepID=A0A8H7B755_9PLEO|nr:uncharacterized protein GT037_004120 [Alternaria burnsii]KAF7678739.1 hypothetical protein GT037_004120 [Alternaria burnsii]CAI9637006.1 unnamed protein product [Alternaria burnsii]
MAPMSLAQKLANRDAKKTSIASPTAASSVLANAFVTAPGSKARQQEAEIKVVDAGKIYPLSFGDRKLLATGPKAQIIDSEGNVVTDIPVALFRATSTKKEMVAGTNGTGPCIIKLPTNLEVQPVKDLIKHFIDLTTWNKFARDLHPYQSTYWDLQMCSAADFLGMHVYTQHLFNWYWARISSGSLPDYADIDAISAVQTPVGDSIFRKVVNAIARLDFEGQIPDPYDYRVYLKTNERFGVAVEEAKKKMQKHQTYVDKKNWLEAKAKLREESARLIYQQRQKQLEERAATQQAKWDEQKKKDAELAARVKAKMAEPGKKKWKADEAGYLRRVRGINVPIM